MDLFIQQTISGLAFGGIFASIALALTMIHRSTELINLAQGEMAMFSTYIAWALITFAGLPYWGAFIVTVGGSFLIGLGIQQIILRPLQQESILTNVIVFIGLLLVFNSVAGYLFTFTIRAFPSPFPATQVPIMGTNVPAHMIGTIAVVLLVLLAVFLFFRYTTVGLAMRAAAQNQVSARLCGVRVGVMLGLGWGLAAAIGSIAGMMVAHVIFLEPNMMAGVLLFGFCGAILGGIDNPAGSVAGGFIVGVLINWIGAYVPYADELRLTIALVLIVTLLLVKPGGLFGKVHVQRV